MKLEKKVKKIEKGTKNIEKSYAREYLHEYKRANTRLFVIFIFVLLIFAGYLIYNEYRNNDTDTTTETIEIDGVESIDNSHIKIGDNIWEKSQ